jgi:flavorubredoxin
LQYIDFSHFEADECGALNHWFRLAPNAEILCGSVAARTSIGDFAVRLPHPMADGDTVDLGAHRLQLLETPHFPHNWDAVLWLEPHTGVLFSSDLGTHTGQREAVTEEDRSQEIVDFVRQSGYMAPGVHVTTALSRLRALPITCLAAMHGSAIQGAAIQPLYDALEDACGTAS